MKDLRETLELNKEHYIEQLKNLININTSVINHGRSGGLEKEGQLFLEELLKEMGAEKIVRDQLNETIIEKSFHQYNEGNLGHCQKDRFNLYATFKGKSQGKSILFNSHIDVMPAEEEGWIYPAFRGTIEKGRLYGRGAADMKAGLMASVMAIQLLQDADYNVGGDVIITSVCDEEGGGNGSIQAVMNGIRADAVVNCEPTEEELIIAHMGWVFFKVAFKGKACHSGQKSNGVSAIEKAILVIKALDELEKQWSGKYKHPYVPPPNLNIGVIEGGTAGSTVPENCMFETCVHYTPGLMDFDKVVKEVREVIEEVVQSDEWLKANPPQIEIYQQGNGFEMEANHEICLTFEEVYEKINGRKVNLVGSPSGCDSRLWRNIAKCPTIQYGPGSLAQCHAVNEWVSIEEYLNTILIYAELILKWCV